MLLLRFPNCNNANPLLLPLLLLLGKIADRKHKVVVVVVGDEPSSVGVPFCLACIIPKVTIGRARPFEDFYDVNALSIACRRRWCSVAATAVPTSVLVVLLLRRRELWTVSSSGGRCEDSRDVAIPVD
jgi:hypothetical protein